MRNITVTFADGTSHTYQNAPDDITPDAVEARASKEFGKQVTGLDGGKQSAQPGLLSRAGQTVADVGAGALKGASQIGATILSPLDYLAQKAGVSNSFIGRNDRREAVTQALQDAGANTDSLAFKVGEIGTEIAGTAGVGGVLAKGVMAGSKLAPTIAPMVANSLRTGGMTTGAPAARALSGEGARNAAIRVGGGAASGAAMAGMINPEDAGMGAVIGGAIPVVGKVAGEAGKAIGKSFTASPDVAQLAQKAKSLGIDIPADRLAKSKILDATAASLNYVPFSGRIATETRMNDQIKTALSKTFGENTPNLSKDLIAKTQSKLGGQFNDFFQKNNLIIDDQLKTELYKKLELAKGELGNDSRYKALKNQVDNFYKKSYSQSVDNSSVTLADIEAINASRAAHPDVSASAGMGNPFVEKSTLLADIRNLGGISTKDMRDLVGEKAINKAGAQVGVFTNNGEEVGDMVRRLVDKGTLPKSVLNDVDGGAQALREEIQNALNPSLSRNAAEYQAYLDSAPMMKGAFISGKSAAPKALPFEQSNEMASNAAYDTKKVLDRMSKSIDSSVSHHAREVRNSITEALKRSVGEVKAKEFTELQRKYANLQTVKKLAGNTAEGDISMARLGNLDSKNQEVSDLAKIAATFAKGRESPHGAMQRVTIGGGVAALGGGALAGLAAPVAVGLTGGRLANMALNSNALKKMITAQPKNGNKLANLLANPAVRAAAIASQSK